MAKKPELIAFSQYKIGGVQSFYYNILSNDPYNAFDKKWIFVDDDLHTEPKPVELYGITKEIVIKAPKFIGESVYSIARRINEFLSNREGVVLTNFEIELRTLHIYRKRKKTVFFICHDELYVDWGINFEFLIDVYIAHNITFYKELRAKLPHRQEDIYYKPYGVTVPLLQHVKNPSGRLKVVFAARLQPSKGVLDIPVIDELLQSEGIIVEWTIVGDGPLRKQAEELTLKRGNFKFRFFSNNESVREEMALNDIFILPSTLDGLPVAMLEAMSVGCVPVISEFNDGIKEVITENVGFVVPMGDTQAFASVLRRLNNNREELELKSSLARKKIIDEYDIQKRAKEYFDLFLNYQKLKRPYRYKSSNYEGYLDHPSIPAFIGQPLKKLKQLFAGIIRK